MPQAAIASSPALLAAAPARGGGAPEKSGPAPAEGPNSFSSVLNRQTQQPAKNDAAGKPSGGKDERPTGETTANAAPAPATRPAESGTPGDAKAVQTGKTDDAATAEPATDAIALLAGMLAGITTPAAASAANDEAATTDDPPVAGQTAGDGATPIAAPLTVASNAAATRQAQEPAQGEAGAILPDTGRSPVGGDARSDKDAREPTAAATPGAGAAKDGAANLAAAAATRVEAADVKQGQGAKHENFEAVLAAARAAANATGEASLQAANKTEAGHPTPQIATPVGQSGWASEVGEKLTWMVGNLNSKADLVLTPPNMGRIEVSLTVSGDQATASFVAANPAVRDALENAVPRLREVLQDAGINLGQTHVGAEAFRQSADGRESGDNRSRGGDGPALGDDAAQAGAAVASGGTRWLRTGTGLVDTFA